MTRRGQQLLVARDSEREIVDADSRVPRGALRLHEIHLENWRNFRTAEMALGSRAFVVGPNASGKSNLLDAIRFLAEVAGSGGLEEAVGMPPPGKAGKRGGLAKIRSLHARQQTDVVVRVVVGPEDQPRRWEYELRFGQESRTKAPVVKGEVVHHDGRRILNRPNSEDKKDSDLLSQTHLQQVNLNREFRELAEFLRSVRYLHIVPQLIRDPQRSTNVSNDPFGGDFLQQIANTPVKTQRARMRRVAKALKVAVPNLEELELHMEDKTGSLHIRGKYSHWRKPGAWQNEDQFSDGTLRLLGLLWALQDGEGPLLLEEPELSLHPEVVRFIPSMFWQVTRRTGRQIIVSTHSTDMLEGDGIGLDEVILLQPGDDGTKVRPASTIDEAAALLQGGTPLSEVVEAYTRPENAHQLSLQEFK